MTLQELMALSAQGRGADLWRGDDGSWQFGGVAAFPQRQQAQTERSYLRGLGQPEVPEGIDVLGPSDSFRDDPAYQPPADVVARGEATTPYEPVTGSSFDPGSGERRNAGLDWAAVLMQLGSAVAAAIAASKQKRQKTLIAVS